MPDDIRRVAIRAILEGFYPSGLRLFFCINPEDLAEQMPEFDLMPADADCLVGIDLPKADLQFGSHSVALEGYRVRINYTDICAIEWRKQVIFFSVPPSEMWMHEAPRLSEFREKPKPNVVEIPLPTSTTLH